MTCRELVDFLMAYLDGDLPAAQRQLFEEHLIECAHCVAYVRSYRDSVALAKACADEPVPSEVPAELVAAITAARARG